MKHVITSKSRGANPLATKPRLRPKTSREPKGRGSHPMLNKTNSHSRQGRARHGRAGRGEAGRGRVRLGVAGLGKARRGMAR
jgi:hypothetical protein